MVNPKLKHRLFTGFSLASAVIAIFAAAMWIRSYSVGDQLSFGDRIYNPKWHEVTWNVDTGFGAISIGTESWNDPRIGASRRAFVPGRTFGTPGRIWTKYDPPLRLYLVEVSSIWNRAGFGYFDHTYLRMVGSYQVRRLVIPFWALTIALMIIPAIWMIRWIKNRRTLAAGLCPACGYDLRASPERCPECGRAVDRAPNQVDSAKNSER